MKDKKKKPFERRKMYILITAHFIGHDEYELVSPVPMNREEIIETCQKKEFEFNFDEDGEDKSIKAVIGWCDTACVGDTLRFSSTQYLIYIGMTDFLPSLSEIVTKKITTVEVKVNIQKK